MYTFPNIFITGQLENNMTLVLLCANALEAWGACMAGADIPEKFGVCMAKIGEKLGIQATPENLRKLAKENKWL